MNLRMSFEYSTGLLSTLGLCLTELIDGVVT